MTTPLLVPFTHGERGMADMSKKFIDMGAQVYVEAGKVKESNKAL